MSMGYIDCDGVLIPVIRVELTGGAFLVTGERKGPLRAYSGPATLVGDDGRVIADPEHSSDNHVSWTVVRRGQVLTLPFRCTLEGMAPRVIQGELAADSVAALAQTGPRALPA